MGGRGGHILTVREEGLVTRDAGEGQLGQLRLCDVVLIVAPGVFSGAGE